MTVLSRNALLAQRLASLVCAACAGTSIASEVTPTWAAPPPPWAASEGGRSEEMAGEAVAETVIASEPLTAAAQAIVDTATGMANDGTVIRGSCYDYANAVFTRAGYRGWRRRETAFRTVPEGPYADLDLIHPGDWLFFVNHPDSDPLGTHSAIFMEWENRREGYARVLSYVGGRADQGGVIVPYDVTMTYSIVRAIDPAPRPSRPVAVSSID